MADSGAIKAGEAFVELTTKNSTKAGIDAANKDIAAGTAKMTDFAKASFLANETQKKSVDMVGQWAAGLFKVSAAIWVVKQAYTSMMEKANALVEKQIERANELGAAWRRATGRDIEERNQFIPFGTRAEQAAKTQSALGALDLAGKASQLNSAQQALDSYLKSNKLFDTKPFGKDVEPSFIGMGRRALKNTDLDRSDVPFAYPSYNKGERALLESNLEKAKESYKQVSEAADDYRKKLKELGDAEKDPALIGAVDTLTKSLQAQIATFGQSAEEADITRLKLGGASPGMVKTQQDLGYRLARMRSIEASDLNRAELREALRSEDEDMYWKRRQGALSVGGGTKGAFGTNVGGGMFDFGGGGVWQGIGVTLKDMLESDLRKERLIEDANRKLDDTFQ